MRFTNRIVLWVFSVSIFLSFSLLPKNVHAHSIDLGSVTSATAVTLSPVYLDRDGPELKSDKMAPIGDFNGDGFDDFVIGSAGATNPQGYAPGKVYIVFGGAGPWDNVNLNDIETDNQRGFIIRARFERIGQSVAGVGDFNGDGYTDISTLTSGASACIIFGRPAPHRNINVSELFSGFYIVLDDSRTFSSIVGAGDVNDDGLEDVVITVQAARRAFEMYVLYGRSYQNQGGPGGSAGQFPPVFLSSFQTSAANGYKITSNDSAVSSRAFVSTAGDFNGDGCADFVTASVGPTDYVPRHPGLRSPSPCYMFLGRRGATADIALTADTTHSQVIRFLDYTSRSRDGHSIAGAGDFDGDGRHDVVIGSSELGVAYLVRGTTAPVQLIDLRTFSTGTTQGLMITGLPAEGLGYLVAGGGDINNDDLSDLVLAAPGAEYNERPGAGSLYVVYGRGGMFNRIDLAVGFPEAGGFRIDGPTSNTNVGLLPAFAGDINTDGIDDMLAHDGGLSPQTIGTTFLLFGKTGGPAKIEDWELW